MLAGLYANTQDLEQAIRLAEDKPWKEVMGAIGKVANHKHHKGITSQVTSAKTPPRDEIPRRTMALMNVRAKTKKN